MSSTQGQILVGALLAVTLGCGSPSDDTNDASTNTSVVALAVGTGGILNYDNGVWIPETVTGDFSAVWGSAPNNVFAVGRGGTIVHFDGNRWSEMTSNTVQNLNGVWGSGPSDIFAVGGSNVMHYDGTVWSRLDVVLSDDGADFFGLEGVWGSGASDVYVIGEYSAECVCDELHYFNGSEWSVVGPNRAISWKSIWGSSESDVHVVGELGTATRFDGAQWTTAALPVAPLSTLHSVWGTASDNVLAFHNDAPHLWRFDGASWTSEEDVGSPATVFESAGISGANARVVFAVAGDAVFSYDGQNWSKVDVSALGVSLKGVWVAPQPE